MSTREIDRASEPTAFRNDHKHGTFDFEDVGRSNMELFKGVAMSTVSFPMHFSSLMWFNVKRNTDGNNEGLKFYPMGFHWSVKSKLLVNITFPLPHGLGCISMHNKTQD